MKKLVFLLGFFLFVFTIFISCNKMNEKDISLIEKEKLNLIYLRSTNQGCLSSNVCVNNLYLLNSNWYEAIIQDEVDYCSCDSQAMFNIDNSLLSSQILPNCVDNYIQFKERRSIESAESILNYVNCNVTSLNAKKIDAISRLTILFDEGIISFEINELLISFINDLTNSPENIDYCKYLSDANTVSTSDYDLILAETSIMLSKGNIEYFSLTGNLNTTNEPTLLTHLVGGLFGAWGSVVSGALQGDYQAGGNSGKDLGEDALYGFVFGAIASI